MLSQLFSGPGYLTAGTIFFYLATQEVSGIPLLRSLAEILLLVAALHELSHSIPEWRRLLINPVALSTLLFVSSALFACIISPSPALSFSELKTPLLKNMLLIPCLFSLAVMGLLRHNWEMERIARLLLLALSVSGLGQLMWTLTIYAQHFVEFGKLPADPYFHRYKVGAALIVFPFVLLSTRTFSQPWNLLMKAVTLGLLLVILTSNARGAWLGFAASICYLYLVNRELVNAELKFHKTTLLVTSITLVFALLMLSGTAMIDTFFAKIAQGFDTGHRLGYGVWGATFDMILQHPWPGYGYGDAAYTAAYNALAEDRPEWIFRKSVGAHNSILTHWVAAGIFGLIAIFALYTGFLIGTRQLLYRYNACSTVRNLLHAGVAAMLALYLVRGQVETVRWDSYGTLMAILLWLFALKQPVKKV